MLKLTVPEAITLKEGTADRVYPFVDFVLGMAAIDQRFNATARSAYAAERIARALEGKYPGDVVELESTDGELLKGAASDPSNGYPVRPARFVAPYLKAIELMSEVTP